MYGSNALKNNEQPPVLSHTLKKIICLIGREEMRQICYVTQETIPFLDKTPAVECKTNDKKIQKNCYVFETTTRENV